MHSYKKQRLRSYEDEEKFKYSLILLKLSLLIQNERSFFSEVRNEVGLEELLLEFTEQIERYEDCRDEIIKKISTKTRIPSGQQVLIENEEMQSLKTKNSCFDEIIYSLQERSISIREQISEKIGEEKLLTLSKNQTIFIFDNITLFRELSLIEVISEKGETSKETLLAQFI